MALVAGACMRDDSLGETGASSEGLVGQEESERGGAELWLVALHTTPSAVLHVSVRVQTR